MTLEEFKAKYPDIYQACYDEGQKAGHKKGLAEGEASGMGKGRAEATGPARAEGAKAERERIKSVEAQLIPGHEALIDKLKFDGKTTGEQAAVQILQAEKTLRTNVSGQLDADAPDAVAHAAAPDVETSQEDNENLPIEERAKAKWDKDASTRKEFGDYDSYLAYAKAVDSGRVKVLGKK